MQVERRLDTLGRITIPVDMRRQLNIGYHDAIYIEFVDKKIIITTEKDEA